MSRRTKIVATLGPASSTPESIRALLRAGVNVTRINFSHGTHAQHAQTIAQLAVDAFTSGRADRVLLVYNEFRSVISQRVVIEKLLPIPKLNEAEGTKTGASAEAPMDYLFEPDPEQLLTTLLPLMSVAVGGNADSGLGRSVVDTLARFGLAPTIGVMLVIIVGGMILKSLLLLLANRQVGYTVAQGATARRRELSEALLRSRGEDERETGQPEGEREGGLQREAIG